MAEETEVQNPESSETETKSASSSAETRPTQPQIRSVVVGTQRFDLREDEYEAMARYGIEKYLEEINKPQDETPEESESDEVNDPKDVVTKKFKELEDKINKLTGVLSEDLSARRRKETEAQLEATFNDLSKQFKETADNPKLAKRIQKLTINRALEEQNANLIDIYKEELEVITGSATKVKKDYVEDKLKDKENTVAPAPGSTPGNEPSTLSWKDLESGKVRQLAAERMRRTSPFKA